MTLVIWSMRMVAVARVDPLGRIAEPEVAAALQARARSSSAPHIVLGHARIDRAFIDDRRAARRVDQPGDRPRRGQQCDRSGRLSASTGVGTVTIRCPCRGNRRRRPVRRRRRCRRAPRRRSRACGRDPRAARRSAPIDVEADDVEIARPARRRAAARHSQARRPRSWDALSSLIAALTHAGSVSDLLPSLSAGIPLWPRPTPKWTNPARSASSRS